jgi:hypothetical protein
LNGLCAALRSSSDAIFETLTLDVAHLLLASDAIACDHVRAAHAATLTPGSQDTLLIAALSLHFQLPLVLPGDEAPMISARFLTALQDLGVAIERR